ncbi:MAG: M3 family oligoendopeptidase [Candidatus Roizmanbacteria bacterium]|nr:MAG: M3 family oligoendopeptidase [Candidatus Roizmanbacteria bacterium]
MQKTNNQTEWDLSSLYKRDNDPEIKKNRKIIEENSEQFVKKWRNRKDYLENPSVLKEALDEYNEFNTNYADAGKEGYYFHLRYEKDQLDPKLRSKYNQTQDFKNKIDNKMRFFYLSLAKISPENQKRLLKYVRDADLHPLLSPYKHFLETIFKESKHLLSEEEENILSLKSVPAYENWVKMTASFLSKEERKVLLEDGTKVKKSFSEILSLVDSTNEKVRDEAARAFNEILKKYSDVAVEELNSIVENKKIDDELRKIPSPDYSRHLHDDIDTSTVEALIKSVSKRFDISQKFYELKAKLLKVKKLKYHERNVPYGDINKNYTYNQSVELIHKVFKNLDKEFDDIFTRFSANGQIDVYPKKGKRGGAFCAYHLISEPTFILLNFGGKLDDTLTIAHELGHGINNELIKTKQNALNFATPTSTAEVASTFMEDFVLEEVLKEADEHERLNLMMMKLNSDISTIFRQIALYKFELELHKLYRNKGYLPKDIIGKIFQKNMSDYMGEYVEQSAGSENWWLYWQHVRYFFYVYSYASGLLISKSLQSLVRKDPQSIEKVKEFLSAGTSESPRNIFLKLGIDISDKFFWNRGISEVENLLNETTKLAKKLKKYEAPYS